MAYNSRQSNVFGRSSQQMKAPGSVMKKKKQQQQQQKQQTLEHDLIIPDQEIIACLSELPDLNFTWDDLRKPSPVRAQLLYEYLVDTLMGIRVQTVEMLVQAAGIEGPQREAAMLMTFYRSLSQLMQECNVTDFTFKDLTNPDSDRLRMALSSVINFLRFRGEKLDTVMVHYNKGEQVRSQIEQYYAENEELAARVAALRNQRELEEPAIKEAQQINMELKNTLKKLQREQQQLAGEFEGLKQEKVMLRKTLEDKTMERELNMRECKKLEPYIVDSPDRLQKVLTDLADVHSGERATLDTTERQVRVLQTSKDSFSMVEADVTSCIKLMEEVEADLNRKEEHMRQVNRYNEKLHQKEVDLKELERKEERCDRLVKGGHEKLQKAREQAEAKRAHSRAEMDRLAREYEELAAEREAIQKECNKRNLEIERKQKEMADLKENLEEEIRQAKIQYEKLFSHIQSYVAEMEQVIRAEA